jgi:hypothetical protein|tara:strand:- start:977 stop:2128 length:1152 start_codon:yes stop_codon:yes gene_type:complete
MKTMIDNISELTEEFVEVSRRSTQPDPGPEVETLFDSHTENGCNYMMVTLTHTGTCSRQHMGLALDFSTSMSQMVHMKTKKRMLIDATKTALSQMHDDDMVTVVVYGSHAECIIEKVRIGNADTIPKIINGLYQHEYMGATNPGSALHLLKECDQTLILSDGQFNEGPLDPGVLHGIVKHSLLCGSIFPGMDMTALAEVSEGTYFNLNCNNYEDMVSLLASSLSAPPIKVSNIVLTTDKTYNLPSLRTGCSVRYVFPVLGDSVHVSYMDDNAHVVENVSQLKVTGENNSTVKRVLALQTAAKFAEEALRTGNSDLRSKSTTLYQEAGFGVMTDEDMKRVSSSNRQQFSIDPESMHCPQLCRDASLCRGSGQMLLGSLMQDLNN